MFVLMQVSSSRLLNLSRVMLQLIVFYACTTQASESIDLDRIKSGDLVGLHSNYFLDESGELAVNDLQLRVDKGWLPVKTESLSLGYTASAVWIKLELENKSVEPNWFLHITYPVLDYLDIYVQYKDRTDVYNLGDRVNFYDRPIDHRDFVIPVYLNLNESATVMLRVSSSSSLQIPIKLWKQSDFYENEQSSLIWQGIYFGFILVMAFYNLCLYYYIRETQYIYYAFTFASFLLFQATIGGFSYQFLWPDSPILQDHALPIFLGSVLFSESLFVRSLLGLKIRSPKIAMFFSLSAILSALIIIFSSVVSYRISIMCLIVLALLINFVGLFVGIKQSLQGNKTAKLFTIAWVGTLLGAIVLALSKLGLIERNLFNENALQIGTAISVVWLSFALGEYITQQNRQRQEAKEEALEYALKIASERKEKLSAQEMILNIQQQANATLESQVKHRTDQLEKTMSDLEIANAKLKHISHLDELTGLYNRRYLNQKLEAEFLRAQRIQKPLAILLADIDLFKSLNDKYGHLAGDACLKAVSNVLKNSVTRPEDTVSRFGGEEFVILLPDTPEQGALRVAERLLKEVANETVVFEDLALKVTVSIGLTVNVPLSTEKPEGALAKADAALYQAKGDGRNRVCQVHQRAAAS